jgi:hypothetical protein
MRKNKIYIVLNREIYFAMRKSSTTHYFFPIIITNYYNFYYKIRQHFIRISFVILLSVSLWM